MASNSTDQTLVYTNIGHKTEKIRANEDCFVYWNTDKSYFNHLLIWSHSSNQASANSLITNRLNKSSHNWKTNLSFKVHIISLRYMFHVENTTISRAILHTSASSRALLMSLIGSTMFSLFKTSETQETQPVLWKH